MIKCIILDLDGTLVNTSALETLRAQGRWREAANHVHLCSLYNEVVDVLNTARTAGIKVAIFTNSPSIYVRNVLGHFELTVDYIVAYHDVRHHKPGGEGVDKILSHFDVNCEEAIYLGDSDQDRDAAFNANVKFIAVDWGMTSSIKKPQSNLSELLEFIGSGISKPHTNHYRTSLLQKGNHFFLGYYLSGIKQEVWSFKDGNEGAINRWINKTIELSGALPKIDIVVRALGHAELDNSVNDSPLNLLGSRIAASIDANYMPDSIQKGRILAKSTKCSAKEREQQVHGVYTVNIDFIGLPNNAELTFLVVDDVLTSGATFREISRALSSAYPKARIYIFTLVKTVYRSQEKSESIEAQHNAQLFLDLYSQEQRQPEFTTDQDYIAHRSGRTNLFSKQLSANYAKTNHNFVFQNLKSFCITSEPESKPILNAVYVLKNMLQRGKPTIASRRLRSSFGLKQSQSELELPSQALISKRPIEWLRLIRGDAKTGNYPAKRFFYEMIAKHFGEYEFVKQLTLPEVQIFDMTQVYVEQFHNRQVDFFISHVGLIIEIDGLQHKQSAMEDENRDAFTNTLGLKTVRFTTQEIATENQSFVNKIRTIVDHLRVIDRLEQEGVLNPPNGITLQDYRRAYNDGIDTNNPCVRLTAAIRFQLLVLELVERGEIKLGEYKTILLLNRDGIDFVHLALEDLKEMLGQLLTLMGIPELELKVNVEEVPDFSIFRPDSALFIDFSIFERFDDSFQANHSVIYVRTHYLDFYRYFADGDAISIENCSLVDYDFFEMSCSEPITYELDLSPESKHREALKYFLSNLFLPYLDEVDFREGQVGIIGSALSRKGTIGLLPTGSGKSICYQLSAILQPAISFVVCPIKSLMYDQKADLDAIGFTRSNFITSDLKPNQKIKIQNDFGRGKYFFVFISPERFQTQGFRSEMTAIGLDRAFAFAVIDEAHCLSEWGHDFRTSYLNLAKTIERLAPDSTHIGLTATASVNVLKDIQSEFNIPDNNVRAPLNFTRDELSFHVIDDGGRKTDTLLRLVGEMESKWNRASSNEEGAMAGIVFTPTVNGNKGCYELAGRLSSTLNMDVRFFAGSAPKNRGLLSDGFDAYKYQVQNDFKFNKYRLLTATKAFGMGVNKGNIAYTIHYGIPGSMEALYQEAGRAGRDKKLFAETAADCYVLLTKERNTSLLDKIWDASATVAELRGYVGNLNRESDVSTNLFLMTNRLNTINEECNLIINIYEYFAKNSEYQTIMASASMFQTDKLKFEIAVYRLSQLGIVSDWIVEDFFAGKLKIEFECIDDNQLHENLEHAIKKYDTNFELSHIFQSSNQYYKYICDQFISKKIKKTKFIFLVLLLWSYDHFVYNRRQSLKTVYEQCSDLAAGRISEFEFKNRLEGYFKFNNSSHLLHYLAENSADTSIWLSVFFEENGTATTKKILSTENLSTLKEQLSRFLESYKDNICLNYLSGVIRLAADQFDDADGERRISSSLDHLKFQNREGVESLIRDTLELKPLFSVDAQCRFARLIHEKFPEPRFLEMINADFGDPYSYRQLLIPLVSRLENIIKLYNGIKW